MSTFHTKKESKKDNSAHLNFMGGPSWDISNPLVKLRIAASSCFFGEPQYYHTDAKAKTSFRSSSTRLTETELTSLRETLNALDPQEWRGLSPAAMMESAIDAALDFDPEGTLKEAVRLRQEENIRTTPQVILVRAAHNVKVKATGLVRKYAKDIISRADEPSVGLAYHKSAFAKKAIPNSLKKAWRDSLQRFNDYQLAKYRMENKNVKTVDVMNLVHPKSDSIHKLANNELKTTGETWESIISAEGSNEEAWRKSISHMGHMALLRNIRNLLSHSVKPEEFVDKLVKTAADGKQLPFRYVSAYNTNSNAPPQVIDAIENCLFESIGNLPQFKGRVMSLCDNSGSAWSAATSSMGTMPVATIANLTGIITGMASDEGHIGVFGDRLETFPIRKRSSVFDQLKKIEKSGKDIGGGTEHGIWLFWDKAIKNKEHWDHVFVYSDMQAGHGGLYGTGGYNDFVWSNKGKYIDVPKLINKYRSTVNPNVKVYLVQVAGQQDTIVPEWYKNTYILGGWGDGLLRFASEMANLEQICQKENKQ